MNIIRHQVGCDYFICNAQQDLDKYFDFSLVIPTVIKVCSDGGAEDGEILAAAASNDRLRAGTTNRMSALPQPPQGASASAMKPSSRR